MPQSLDPYQDGSPDAAISLRRYLSGSIFKRHTHNRGQFAYASLGVMKIFTDQGNWVVPPQRAIWVPAGVPHEMHMLGDVTMINVYVNELATGRAGLPRMCQVYDVSPLLRHLFEAALSIDQDEVSCIRSLSLQNLLIDEIGAMAKLPFSAPLPSDSRLTASCFRFLKVPKQNIPISEMASWSYMSRRTFTRCFRAATGMSYVAWRQQVCLLEATARLSSGASITEVSFDLGYSSPSAFTALFRRHFGDPPGRYLTKSKGDPLL